MTAALIIAATTAALGAAGYWIGSDLGDYPGQTVGYELILMVVGGLGGFVLSGLACIANIWGQWWRS